MAGVGQLLCALGAFVRIYLYNIAAEACKWVLQQMDEEANVGGRGGEGGDGDVNGEVNWPSSNRAKRTP
jgi:hypothetical protein